MNGIELIAAERQRQIDKEGFNAKHDADKFHQNGELAWAACYYAMPENLEITGQYYRLVILPQSLYPGNWLSKWMKRGDKDRKRQLVVAGALVAAEIDRQQAMDKTD